MRPKQKKFALNRMFLKRTLKREIEVEVSEALTQWSLLPWYEVEYESQWTVFGDAKQGYFYGAQIPFEKYVINYK